jgi:hypothetical protein
VDLVLIVKSEKGVRRLLLNKDVLVLAHHVYIDREGVSEPAALVCLALTRPDLLRVNAAMEMGDLRVILPERMEIKRTQAGE